MPRAQGLIIALAALGCCVVLFDLRDLNFAYAGPAEDAHIANRGKFWLLEEKKTISPRSLRGGFASAGARRLQYHGNAPAAREGSASLPTPDVGVIGLLTSFGPRSTNLRFLSRALSA